MDVMDVIKQATLQAGASEPLRRYAAFHVLSVANASRHIGVTLRWPSPPFEPDHIAMVDDEWRFQLSWTLKFLNERAKLFSSERATAPLPPTPFTEESVQSFVGKVRSILDKRSFFDRFRGRESLTSDEELLRTRCIQILRGNWSSSQILDSASWQMVRIPGGHYLQGNGTSVFENERPAHEVQVQSFWMGGTVVSKLLWAVVMGGDVERTSPVHAAVNLSWVDAIRFCNALSARCGLESVYRFSSERPSHPGEISFNAEANGYRLPTESEWEYAARGTLRSLNQMPSGVDVEHMSDFPISASDISTAPYAGSDLIKEVCWFEDNAREKQPMLAQKRANSFGLYDMSGNVQEWCMDGFGAYSDKVKGTFVQHEAKRERVCRGGAYTLRAELCRVASRMALSFDKGNAVTGFRLARRVSD